MIILKIPRKAGSKDLREFILNQIKKMRRNQKRKHIRLEGEIAYSQDHVYFIFPPLGLELSFALSIYIKCQKHGIPCGLYLSKPFKLKNAPKEVIEAAKVWAERKLHRKYYRLRNITI